MTDLKISGMSSASTPLNDADEVPIVQGGANRKTTVSELRTLPAGWITGAMIAATTIVGSLIANGTIVFAKIQDVPTDTLVGRDTAGTGSIESIGVGASLEFSGSGTIQRAALTGEVTASANSNSTTIASNAVTNPKLADVPSATFKARVTSGTGDPEDITGTQATTLLDTFTSGLKGLAPASGGGSTNFLRADGSWAAPSGAGDVTGPASATDNAITRFDGTTGKLIQNSGATIDDSGNLTATNVSGTNTGDQTITLTGDVTGSGTGSFAATIANDSVTNAKLANIATDTLIGRDTAGTGDPESITLNGTLSFTGTGAVQRAALTGDVTASAGSNATTIAADAVTDAKMRNSGALSVIGRSANSSGDPADISATAASDSVLRESGSTVGFGTIATGGIANDAVTDAKLRNSAGYSVIGKATTGAGDPADIAAADETVLGRTGGGNVAFAQVATGQVANNAITLAKVQDIGTDRLVGRDTAATGDPEELTVGGGLEFTGSGGVQRSALTGDVTASAGSGTTTIAADAVALGTDTTGNYVATIAGTTNEVSVSGSGSETAAVTVSLPTTIDLGGKTSFELPNGAAPTTDAAGEIAFDDNAWAASRGALQVWDGTANTYIIGTLVSDTPTNGQVPKWNTGGTITWEDDSGAGGGAPTGAQYVTLATDAGLSAERVLAVGNGLDTTDGGANGNITIDLDLNASGGLSKTLSGSSDELGIAANGVADSHLRQGAATSVIGRSANSTGNVADIAASASRDVLRLSGSTLGFGPNGFTGDIRYLSKTANYTVVAADKGSVFTCTGGAFTLTLTAAATLGDGFWFYVSNENTTTTNVITIDPNSTETIDGQTTTGDYSMALRLVYCDGSNWRSKLLKAGYVQFTSTASFVRPTGVSFIQPYVMGGGGGGGSGEARASGAARNGGAGGGGGCLNTKVYLADHVVSVGGSITCTVAAGGAGGTGASSPNNGNNGSVGGDSTFGSLLTGFGGGGGCAGTNANARTGGAGGGAGSVGAVGGASNNLGGGPGASRQNDASGSAGAGGGTTGTDGSGAEYGGASGAGSRNNSTSAGLAGGSAISGGAGGGGGAGTTTANTAVNGGNGGRRGGSTASGGAAGGSSGTPTGANGTTGDAITGSTGAGGGYCDGTGAGGAGGTGGVGCGGGGGGAGTGATSGAGGTGGRGEIIVIYW